MIVIKYEMNEQERIENEKAIELHSQLNKIKESDLIPYAIKRNSDRKEFAKAVRSLFKKLGLKYISVTTPNYSMASSIDIILPKRPQTYNYYKMNLRWEDEETLREKDYALTMNRQASKYINYILNSCFPTKNDRSETMTDYFDFKYMVS